MMQALKVICLILAAIAGNLYLENTEVRRDQEEMASIYNKFLAIKVGGETLQSKIRQDSLAVFKSQSGLVACAVMR